MLELSNKKIEMDSEGYLKDTNQWSKMLAKTIAERESIVLSEEHWEVIWFVRKFYLEFNILPAIRMLVEIMANKFGNDKGNSYYLYHLFPVNPIKLITKIAGLPKPVRCI